MKTDQSAIRDSINRISIDTLTRPRPGLHEIIIDEWWIVDENNNVLIYNGLNPQCNRNQQLTEMLRNRLYPGLEVRQIPVVYLKHNTKY